jgi:hypothetical protein
MIATGRRIVRRLRLVRFSGTVRKPHWALNRARSCATLSGHRPNSNLGEVRSEKSFAKELDTHTTHASDRPIPGAARRAINANLRRLIMATPRADARYVLPSHILKAIAGTDEEYRKGHSPLQDE